MPLTVLIPSNTFRLTTLQAVLDELPASDQLLFTDRLIDQSSAAIARYCGCIFAQQQYLEDVSMWYGGRHVTLGYRQGTRPLVSVQSITHDTYPFTDWSVDSWEAAILYRHTGWGRGTWASWGCGGVTCTGVWDIQFIGGYILPEQINPPEPTGPELPEDIERATIECCKSWFHERLVSERIQSRTLGDQRIDYGVQSLSRGIPALSKDLLKGWRRMRVA